MNNKPSSEERIWSVLAHLSALAMGVGLPLPIAGWSQNRYKSNYASFQSLQALGYQTLGYTIWILVTLVVGILELLDAVTKLIVAVESGADTNSLLQMATGGHYFITFMLVGVYFAMPIIAAIACALGMDFRYPLMGKRLAKYLGYNAMHTSEEQTWFIEEHEDRWVAATAHFSVIVVLWGLLAPLFVWMLQGKRSVFLRFQSVQTVVYQAGTLLLYFVAGFFYVFGLVAFALTIGFEGAVSFDATGSLIGVIVFLFSLLIAMLIVLVVPLLHILGQWAGYRVLKGDMYRYPIIGKLVETRLSREPKLVEETPA